MENNRRENFEDLLKTVADLKSRLDELERRIDEYRSAFGDSLKMPLPEEIPFEQEDFLGDMSELVADGDEIRINADEPEAAGPGTVSGPETSPESGTASEPEAEPETEAAPETEAEPEPDAEPEPAAEPESAAEPEAEPLQEEDDEPFSLFGEMFGAAPARKPSRSRTLNEANASRASGVVLSSSAIWSLARRAFSRPALPKRSAKEKGAGFSPFFFSPNICSPPISPG